MDYKGIIGVIIAFTLGATLMVAVIGLIWTGKSLGDKGGEVMIATVTGLVGGLGYYMGSRNGNSN